MAPDAGIGTLVTMNSTSPCFVAGTRIATDRGEVAVEALKAGDFTKLVDGRTAPIVWVGRRRVDCSRHPDPKQVWPVRVSANAFGPGEPHRDLYLSPGSTRCLCEDVLIPVKYLINGIQHRPNADVAEVTYHHIELASHDVLIAEGLPTESYLDTGDRSNFDNGGCAMTLHPNFAVRVWEGMGCARLVVVGRRD